MAAAVAAFASAGLDAGEPTIVIATQAHWARVEEALAVLGWNDERIRQGDLLLYSDAEVTLTELLEDGRPTARGFEQAIVTMLDELDGRFPAVGSASSARWSTSSLGWEHPRKRRCLEGLWNEAAERRSMLLLCGYQLDVFDRETQVALLPGICRTHSHVRPAADLERMQRAVDAAIDEKLGDRAGQLYAMVGDPIRRRRCPPHSSP